MEPKYVEQRSDRVTTTGCRFFDKTTISVVRPFVCYRIFRAFGRLPDESITRTVYTSATVHRIPRRHRVRRVASGAKSNLFSLGIPCICSHVSEHGNWTLSLEGNKFRLLSENWSRFPSKRRNVVSRTFSALKGRERGTATEEACTHARVCVRVHCLRKRFCVRGVKLIGFICVQQHGIFIVIFFLFSYRPHFSSAKTTYLYSNYVSAHTRYGRVSLVLLGALVKRVERHRLLMDFAR